MKGKSLAEREFRERQRRRAVELAVNAADQLILDCSDGSVEETNFLTSEVAAAFNRKVQNIHQMALMKKDNAI